jgi:hypothetical protein
MQISKEEVPGIHRYEFKQVAVLTYSILPRLDLNYRLYPCCRYSLLKPLALI